jgi:mannosyltransferase OCH1-like enzyme
MIEKNIHQVWVGKYRMPKHIIEYTAKMKEVHPSFNYYFWTDDNVPQLPDRLQAIYDKLSHPALQCDLLRIYLVYTYGGVYLDVDWLVNEGSTVLNQIDFEQDKDAMFIYHEDEHQGDVGNSFMASKKGNPMFKFFLDEIKHHEQWIGPNWLAAVIKKYFGFDYYEPVPYTKMLAVYNTNQVLGISVPNFFANYMNHIALASWYPGSTWNLKFNSGDYE